MDQHEAGAEMNLEIQTKRLAPGKYRVLRSDGREFIILRGLLEWVIEAQDTGAVGGHPTFSGAKYSIKQGWCHATREQKQ